MNDFEFKSTRIADKHIRVENQHYSFHKFNIYEIF